jgi:ribonuclease G
VILPGESLAKYKERGISPHLPPEPPAEASGAAAEPETAEASATRAPEVGASLPSSLYAAPEAAPTLEPPASETTPAPEDWRWQSPRRSATEPPVPAARAAELEIETEPEPEVEEESHQEPHAPEPEAQAAGNGADVTEEEMTALSERLAEARHEETAAEAEADEVPGEPEVEEEAAPAESAEEEAAQPELPSGELPISARISEPQRARFQRPMRRGGRRGHPVRRRDHRDHRPQPQRRPQLISEVLKAGQEIIVQIAKEPLGKKGARITSHVALPGRYLVYMPTVNHIGVSRRIASAEERSRLRRIVGEAKTPFPGGFIVRTAAEGAADEDIRNDVEFLGRSWEKIRAQAEPRKAPALLHRDLNLVERILRDYLNSDYVAIWIDNEEEYGKILEFVGRFQPKLVDRVKLYTKSTPIFEEFGIQQELDKALRPKVWLKSGGYIVINHTEALVAIDVNTGKYVGRGSTRLEDTIVKTNLEAVKEIVRQIRLRDLGGIIVLDFIDMEERRNRDKVMAALESALRADRAPSKVLSFNEFGLVNITRKRTKQALERVLSQPCPYCTGSGMVKSVPTICYEIQAEARKMAVDLDATSITLRVHPEIAKALKTREAALIEELEQTARKSVIIQADPTLHWEQYDIY